MGGDKKFNKLSTKWLDKIFPWYCVICAATTHGNSGVCEECRPLLPYCISSCATCGAIIHNPREEQLSCGKCQQIPPHFDSLISGFWYQFPINNLIVDYKYNKGWQNIQTLIDLTYLSFEQSCQDALIIPVPSHPSRIRSRGFNVVNEFVKFMRRYVKFEYDDKLILRKLNTPPQAGLPNANRRKNLKNAFEVTQQIQNKKLIIIDDVFTTGTTVNEISRCLKKAGVKKICVWTIAKTKLVTSNLQ